MRKAKRKAHLHLNKADEESQEMELVEEPIAMDEKLDDDALIVICSLLDSWTDLVRLSCASKRLRSLIMLVRRDDCDTGFFSSQVWRHRLKKDRPEHTYRALRDLVRLHGKEQMHAFFNRRIWISLTVFDDPTSEWTGTSDDSEIRWDGASLSIWWKAYLITDHDLVWKRTVHRFTRLSPDQQQDAVEVLHKFVKEQKHHQKMEGKILRWLEDKGDPVRREKDSSDDLHWDDFDEEESTRRWQRSIIDRSLLTSAMQQRQVHMLLLSTRFSTRKIKSSDQSLQKSNTITFFNQCNLLSWASGYPAKSARIYSNEVDEGGSTYSLMCSHRRQNLGKVVWEYTVNLDSECFEDPYSGGDLEAFEDLRDCLIVHPQAKNALTMRQFLHFVALGLSLPLEGAGRHGERVTPYHAFHRLASS